MPPKNIRAAKTPKLIDANERLPAEPTDNLDATSTTESEGGKNPEGGEKECIEEQAIPHGGKENVVTSARVSHVETFNARMLETRRQLVESQTYIGEANIFPQAGRWVRDPNSRASTSIFVTAKSYEAHHTALEEAGKTDEDIIIPPLLNMVLTVVGKVTDTNFFLNPLANYDGEGWKKDITKAARMKFHVQQAERGNLFTNDFTTCLKSARDIVDAVGETKLARSGFIIKQNNTLEFCHDIVRPATLGSRSDWLPGQNWATSWPRISNIAADKLRQLNGTHYVEPLHVYSKEGEKIEPSQYDQLKNALVEIAFTLSHNVVRIPGTTPFESFAANVDHLKVLKLSPIVGNKRRAEDGSSGLVKKMKFGIM